MYNQTLDIPGTNLMLILDAETHFIGACVKARAPHVGMKLVKKGVSRRAGNLVFDIHIGYLTDIRGRVCLFFYESRTRFCKTIWDPTRNAREALKKKLRQLKNQMGRPFWGLGILLAIRAILPLLPGVLPVQCLYKEAKWIKRLTSLTSIIRR